MSISVIFSFGDRHTHTQIILMDITLQFKPAFESLTKNQLLELLFAAKNMYKSDYFCFRL